VTRKNGNGRHRRPRCAICRRALTETESIYCNRCGKSGDTQPVVAVGDEDFPATVGKSGDKSSPSLRDAVTGRLPRGLVEAAGLMLFADAKHYFRNSSDA
jgi:hypothetical protein